MKGYVQVYTGDGKGKTTAALGLVLRAVGAGLRVYFAQFIKCRRCSEIKVLAERFPEVTVRQFGRGCFIKGKPSKSDLAAADAGLKEVREALLSGRYDVVIADEINVAGAVGLVAEAEVLALIRDKPPAVELVLTGRGASAAVRRRAGLVTEMVARKHYYAAGVKARKGIED